MKALQQELSSLHIVMEKSTSEYTRQIDELTKAKAFNEEEKMRLTIITIYKMVWLHKYRLNEQLESLKKEVKRLPTALQDLERLLL